MAVSAIAGNYGGGIPITCILDEGAPTVTASGSYYGDTGETEKVLTWATPIAENDWVAISNDTNVLYEECGGSPVVERPADGDVLVVGKVVSMPKIQKVAATSGVADTLTKRLAADYYRTAVIEIYGGITGIVKARVMCDGTNTVVPGVATYLEMNIAGMVADHELAFDMDGTDNGVGVIPFHDVPNAANGTEYSCLVGLTGLMIAVTGA